MNYKKIIINLLSVSVVACNGLPSSYSYQPYQPSFNNSFRPYQAIDRFQIQDNLIVDTYSNLMWTRCFLGTAWNGYSCAGFTSLYNWKDAQAASKNINHFGYNDWRIPTLEELKSLAEKETIAPITNIPYLNQTVFPTPNCYGINDEFNNDNDAHNCWHWTSTPISGSEHYNSIVYFGYGYGSGNDETDAFALRLVRNNR